MTALAPYVQPVILEIKPVSRLDFMTPSVMA